MLKKCEKNYEAFKEFWKISGLRGHFVLFDNPRHWQKISTKNHSELIFRWTHCLKISNSVQNQFLEKMTKLSILNFRSKINEFEWFLSIDIY